MKTLPTLYTIANGGFSERLTLRDGRLFRRFGDPIPVPAAHIKTLVASASLIPELTSLYPNATITATLWQAVAISFDSAAFKYTDDLGQPIRMVLAVIRSRESTNRWSMATSIWLWPSGEITTGYFMDMVLLSPLHEESQHDGPAAWSLSLDATDDDRQKIITWLDSHGCHHQIDPSQSAAKATDTASRADFDAKWIADDLAKREAATRPQTQDTTPLHPTPITPLPDQCDLRRADDSGALHSVFRLKATGFSVISDWDGKGEWETLLKSKGCTIHYACDAVMPGGGYVGSAAAPLQEIRYTLPCGTVRYGYILTSTTIDDWQQEIWTSDIRLTAGAAADTLIAARKIAYCNPAPPP